MLPWPLAFFVDAEVIAIVTAHTVRAAIKMTAISTADGPKGAPLTAAAYPRARGSAIKAAQ
jgi:hypothetical protein